jgi:hypothetical protein
MKIVKMHKGSREAFDDFLAQRLNEVEIDNDTADKYFADMNLPVPVIPANKISFLVMHKNKVWLLLLLFITSISAYLIVSITKNRQYDTASIKNKYPSNNVKEQSNKNTVSTKNIFKEAENVFEIDKKNELASVNKIVHIDKFKNNISENKVKQKIENLLSNNQNRKVNKANNKKNIFIDTVILEPKAANVSVDKKISSVIVSSPSIKLNKIDKKTPTTDSLYIIW